MSGLPMRRAQFRTADFAAWLASNGAEIGKPTNAYEVIRYRAYERQGSKAATHIVYAKENGLLNFQGSSREHYQLFLSGGTFARQDALAPPDPFMMPKSARDHGKASKGAVTREKLLARDGNECWFCGLALGTDATIEHLVPRSSGGLNGLANYVLAHSDCNSAAADRPLVDKIAMRARMRGETVA